MITLYQFSSSPFTDKVKRALHYKGLDYTIEEVNRLKAGRGRYDHVSPTRKFPAVEIAGDAVNDSTDIIIELDKRYPDKPLIPTSAAERSIAHVIEDWADESLYFYEMLMRVEWKHNIDASWDQMAPTLPKLPTPILKRLVHKGVSKVTATQGLGRKPREQVIADAQRHIDSLDGMLEGKEWLVGDSISVADLSVIAQLKKLMYAQEIQPMVANSKHVEAWIKRVDELAPSAAV
ncbi:glutathione S-transferase family protein [Maricurvus nonylphenolicus]|uniref:glutathione S-transferase family protein n=1 Tax=Maricurvus nonylphenolicus TaxID=1008307 RepID=UPI0036F27B03